MLRGRRSRNKVSVGEPAEGSITRYTLQTLKLILIGSFTQGAARKTPSSGFLQSLLTFFSESIDKTKLLYLLQLLAMDVSARTTMKDAANCDKRCEWQNSANQQNAERILRSQVIPESIPSSGCLHNHAFKTLHRVWNAFMCASDVHPLAHEIRSTEKSCSLSVSYFCNFFRVARFFESMVITSKLFVAHMSLGEATR